MSVCQIVIVALTSASLVAVASVLTITGPMAAAPTGTNAVTIAAPESANTDSGNEWG